MSNGLEQLASASTLSETLKDLKTSGSTTPPWTTSQDTTQRIPGTSWAEEMELLDLILDNQTSDKACVMEVSPRTGECIMASFRSMANNVRRNLRSKFILPRAPVTHAPRLDKVYVESCSFRAQRAPNRRTGLWHRFKHWCLAWLAQSQRPLNSLMPSRMMNRRRSSWTGICPGSCANIPQKRFSTDLKS